MKKLLVALTVAAMLISTAFAQDGGQGGPRQRGQGQGQGQGRQGMMMGMRGMGGGSGLNLLMNAEVQKELALTADQIGKLQAMNEASMQARREARGNPEAAAKMDAEQKAAIAKLLDATQNKRFKEIRIQTAGDMAILDTEVQKELGFTAEQTSKAKKLQDDFQAAMRDMMQAMRDQQGSPEDMQTKMSDMSSKFRDGLKAIPTADQTAKLKTMGGKEFKMSNVQRRRPGGGN